MSEVEECSTPGCDGDARYAAPGRGHDEDCHYPQPPPRGTTMNDRMSDMDALVELAAEAMAECPIPTPWTSERIGHSETWYITGPDWSNGRTCHVAQVAGSGMGSTADLIAAAVNALPALLERVEAAEAIAARVEAVRLRLNNDPEYKITRAHAGHLIRTALTEGTEKHDSLCARQWKNQLGVDHCDCATRRTALNASETP